MKALHKCVLVFLGILLTQLGLFAVNDIQPSEQNDEIFVPANQLILCDSGIYLNLEGCEPIPLNHISYVSDGLFLVKLAATCPRHGQYCPRCGGCHPSNKCSYRCKCGNYPYPPN
jgi:hypothetical protein